MTAAQLVIPLPTEAHRLRDALQDVLFYANMLRRYAATAKRWLDCSDEPRPDDWSADPIEGDDEWTADIDLSTDSKLQEDYGWSRTLRTLREDLAGFWAAHDEAQAALNNLPPHIVDVLDRTTGEYWTVRTRRELDNVATWHYWTQPTGTELKAYSVNVASLLDPIRRGLPDWSEPLARIRRIQDDLFTLRGLGLTAPTPTADPSVPPQAWITVTQAATWLVKDVPSIDFRNAKARVSFAASHDKLRTNGKLRGHRRIERTSFKAWLLDQRDRDLDKVDA